jgi:hypothetical protein
MFVTAIKCPESWSFMRVMTMHAVLRDSTIDEDAPEVHVLLHMAEDDHREGPDASRSVG